MADPEKGSTRPVRLRGMKFPADGPLAEKAAREAFRDGQYQAGLADAVLRLARTDDHILCLGVGAGHVPALLAGKLGVPHVTVADPDANARKCMQDIADRNGLLRLSVVSDAQVQPSLMVIDLSADAIAIPPLDGGLRAAVLWIGLEAEGARLSVPVVQSLLSAGLVPDAHTTSGPLWAFLRPPA